MTTPVRSPMHAVILEQCQFWTVHSNGVHRVSIKRVMFMLKPKQCRRIMQSYKQGFSFPWHYFSLWALTCLTIIFHASLSIAILLQFWILIFPRSSLTSSSSHINLALPILPTAVGLHPLILFAVFSLSILTICPFHLIHCARLYLNISAWLISKPFSSLVFILQLSSRFFIGPFIFLFTFLSNTLNFCSLMSFCT